MTRMHAGCWAGTLAAVVLAGATPAQAGLYKDLARGLALLDYRISGERNILGDGQTFNANAFYNNRRFDFGVAELDLTGTVSMSAGFTRRGVPGADFSLNTGGVPLSYSFKINGAQDVRASGSVLIDIDTDINALGFYDQTFQISNRGTFETNGLLGSDEGTLAFDAGRIEVSGNIFVDALAAVTDPFFQASGTENPFAKLSGQAAKLASATSKIESLQARALAGEILSDAEIASLVNNTILAAMLGGKPSADLFDGLMVPASLTEQLRAAAPAAAAQPVPEPGTFLPLFVGLLAGLPWAVRRRRMA